MSRILIGGIGNVLFADDGIGPFVARTLDARYRFPSDVEVADLGTPGLDLIDYFEGRERILLIDAVKSAEKPGSILLYHQAEIAQCCVGPRTGPHAPSLTETLLTVEMLGLSPQELVLVGVVGQSYETDCDLTGAVREAVDDAIDAVLSELDRWGVSYQAKPSGVEPGIWWTKPLGNFTAQVVQ
jgi:hydrogenase maturation protease